MTQDDSGENSHEIELVVDFFEDGLGEALFAATELLLFKAGRAIGLGVNDGLASKASAGRWGMEWWISGLMDRWMVGDGLLGCRIGGRSVHILHF